MSNNGKLMSRTEKEAYRAFLKEKELEVLDLELNARKQKALLDIKQDFVAECKIMDEYMTYFKIEQEKYLKKLAEDENSSKPEIFEVKE